MRGTAPIVNGTADHVHVLLRILPVHSAAEIARVIKTNSSGSVRAKWSSNFAWQTGYGVFSVSESNVAAVTKYIAGQEEHHGTTCTPTRDGICADRYTRCVAFWKSDSLA